MIVGTVMRWLLLGLFCGYCGDCYGSQEPKNAVHLKLVLIYRNPRITAADDDELYTMLEEILLS